MSEERDAATRKDDAPPGMIGRDDPAWAAAHARLMAHLRSRPDHGYRVGRITEEDKYGPFQARGGPGAARAPE